MSGLNSILTGLQNPNAPDLAGSFEQGQTKGFTGQILAETFGGKLGALGKANPDKALLLAEKLGIPKNEKERFNAYVGTIQAATALANGSGGVEAAIQLMQEHSDRLKQIAPNADTSGIDGQIEFLKFDPVTGADMLNKLTGSFLEQGFIADPKGSTKFSPKSVILGNGTTVQLTNNGQKIVTDKNGRRITGEAAAAAVKEANDLDDKRQGDRAGLRKRETESEGRDAGLIDRGIAAAESTATVRRALTLLDTIETGGIAGVSMAVRSTLGIEGADEGELSNSLGKSVLSQLRETFGAAFTAEEGKSLQRIEAGFGKSVPTNRRLLKQALRIAERTANRAKRKALSKGFNDEAADIDELLAFSLDLVDSPLEQSAAPQLGEGEAVMEDAQGNRAVVKNGKVIREL